MEIPFAELLGRSSFSFLEGASHPDEMVDAAKALSLEALAVCDRDGFYGSVRAHAEAKKVDQRVIVGAEVTIEEEGDQDGEGPRDTVALLAMSHEGYEGLAALLTEAHAGHEKGTAGVTVERVAASAAGLFAIVPVDGRRERGARGDAALEGLVDAFGERLAVATWRHRDGLDRARTAAAIAARARYGVPTVASARPLYHHVERKPLADILYCIKNRLTLAEAGTRLLPNAEAFLRSGAQMLTVFKDQPEWVHRAAEIAGLCRFSLGELRYHFPSDALCLPGETPDQALRRSVEAGCRSRYGNDTPPAVRAQIEKELALIEKLEVAPYFLSVQQIVEIARSRRILCQGRGSAANSAVCFVLGVTAVDPSRSNLLFERFLSEERRGEPPDIDVDFEHERREEVIQAIYAEYGRDRAAMVSEVISFRGKSALREVGKVFGLSRDQLDRLSGLVMHMDEGGMSDARIAEAGLDPRDARLRMVVLWAAALEGFPRHLSIHVGGFVLSSKPLAAVSPIEPARMEGRTVIPWDKDDIEDLGFFKIDVLGLGILTAIRKALAMVDAPYAPHAPYAPCSSRAAQQAILALEPPGAPAPGEASGFDPIDALARIPPEDPAVYAAIQKSDTVGVFQIESRAQMAMLPRLKPSRFYDLVVEVAIVRPGPIQGGMVHPYLRRRMGREPPVAPHPCLSPILERTLGVPLFQEQVMQVAMAGAGYTPGEADQLRRDMAAWKKTGRLARHREKLLQGFAKSGISAEFGEMLYQQIHGFGEYGFPESHAASFALLVYASAWLKVHHPAAFTCALLNSQPMGFYSPSSLVRDAQRHGVEVRPVCVVASHWDGTLEPPREGARARGPALRLGLRQIRGFGEAAASAVVAARQARSFTSLQDLVHRARLRKNEIEALAEAGALAAIVSERREALWRARAPREVGLFEGMSIEPDKDVGLRPMPKLTQLALDYGRVGLSLHDHPMAHLRPELARRGVRRAADLRGIADGAVVEVAGLVIGRQRPGTASGVTFVTLEDETGMVNLILQKATFADNYAVARHATIMLAQGRVERQGDVVHVLALGLERLALPKGEEVPTRSRDFH
jgi:error-prone DNA polymerase